MTDYNKLKTLLDDYYKWPAVYPFKFVVKPAFLEQLKALFHEDSTFSTKTSSKGKYVALNVSCPCESSEQILDIYKQALLIESVISL
jgi:hypothetical protein